MGVRAVASILGFGANKITDWWLFSRCMSQGYSLESREKLIYLCLTESTRCGLQEYTSRVVRPIPGHAEEEDKKEVLLREAVYKTFKGNPNYFPYSTFRSNIIFPFGRSNYATRIHTIDTSKRPLKFPSMRRNKFHDRRYLACFSQGKHDVVLGEVAGKLYCFNNDNRFPFDPSSPSFEFMLKYEFFCSYPLDRPPFLRGKFSKNYAVAFLNESKKILGWQLEKPGVFCFDVTQPNNGWSKVEVPLENHRKPFIVCGCNPNIGEFHVMFTYEPDSQPLVVSAFFMSNNFDHFQPLINKPIELPALCSQYLLSRNDDEVESDSKYMAPTVSSDFEFVVLGNQQIGLILHKYFENDRLQGRNTGIILVLTFEYDIITSVDNTLEIHTRTLGTSRYRYRTKQIRRKTYNNADTCRTYHKTYNNADTCYRYRPENMDKYYVRDLYSETRDVRLNAAFWL